VVKLVKIETIAADKVIDSKNEFQIEAIVNGVKGIAPSGTSRGTYEAKTVPVESAIKSINGNIGKELIGKEFSTQKEFDDLLSSIDGTGNFSKIGGNTSISLSFAFYNLNFSLQKSVFPFTLANLVGGGKHGGNTDFQEFLIIPDTAKTMQEVADISGHFFQEFKDKFVAKYDGTNMEGALKMKMKFNEILDGMREIADRIKVEIGLDIAATELWKGEKYVYEIEKNSLSQDEQISFITDLVETYDIYYVEDPLHEDDFTGFATLREQCKNSLVCGDDLVVTNTERIQKAIDEKSMNSVIIKPNQIGTVTLAQKAIKLAIQNNILPAVSHRSGETHDTTIAKIAVNEGIPLIKIGFSEQDRAKLNELIELWHKAEKPRMAKL